MKTSFPMPGYLQIKQKEEFLNKVLILGCLILTGFQQCRYINSLLQRVLVSEIARWKIDEALKKLTATGLRMTFSVNLPFA